MSFIKGFKELGELAEAFNNIKDLLPSTPTELKEKHRWIRVTVFNQTQYDLELKDDYFDSGKFWESPSDIKAFEKMIFSVCNKDNSVLTGVAGGFIFTLKMPKKEGGNEELDIGIGFSNPQYGSLKSSCDFTSSAKTAYNNIKNKKTTKYSLNYSGNTKDGKNSIMKFKLVSSPAEEGKIYITQEVVSEDI